MSQSQHLPCSVKGPPLSAPVRHSTLPLWLPVTVIIGALLMAAGGFIALVHPAMLAPPGEEINGAVRVYAGYLVSRNLAIAIMLLGTLSIGARESRFGKAVVGTCLVAECSEPGHRSTPWGMMIEML